MNKLNASRRNALKMALFGPGCIGLRSLATGLPISALLGGIPNSAYAQETASPQYLILNSRSAGDPINANAPGTYITGPAHAIAGEEISFGSAGMIEAGATWGVLPQAARNRMAFIHHRTYQNIHGQHDSVMGLVGSALGVTGSGTEMVQSLYASETTGLLGTIQQEPIALSGNPLTFEGRALQSVSPQTLATLFSPQSGVTLQLAQLRQGSLDRIHAELRSNGTAAQRTWLDRYATSKEQIESLDESLLETFNTITSNDQDAQVAAAIALIQMKVSPVIQIGIAFGGDNHRDGGLATEVAETTSGMDSLSALFTQLTEKGIQDEVTVANLSVFGRTLKQKGTNGRNHNLNHHVMMLSGKNVRSGVIGGIEPSGNDYGATSIDSVTGASNGDIPVDETLEAAAKTLGCALGISAERMDIRVRGGKVIQGALSADV